MKKLRLLCAATLLVAVLSFNALAQDGQMGGGGIAQPPAPTKDDGQMGGGGFAAIWMDDMWSAIQSFFS